jgi:hypothetical protein
MAGAGLTPHLLANNGNPTPRYSLADIPLTDLRQSGRLPANEPAHLPQLVDVAGRAFSRACVGTIVRATLSFRSITLDSRMGNLKMKYDPNSSKMPDIADFFYA